MGGQSGADIRRLQAMAQHAAARAPRRRKGPSRAARLHLIDALSRWGGSGLALIAGVTIYIAVTAGRAWPLRAGVWILMTLAALYVARRLRAAYRSGERAAARPFTWRANYTASLCALGAAFGAGAVIVVPEGAPEGYALQSLALLLAGAFGAGLIHAPHGRAAAALWTPAALFVLIGAWRAEGVAAAYAAAGIAIAGSAALFLASRRLRARAMRRFPRTGLLRRLAGARDHEEDDAAHAIAAG